MPGRLVDDIEYEEFDPYADSSPTWTDVATKKKMSPSFMKQKKLSFTNSVSNTSTKGEPPRPLGKQVKKFNTSFKDAVPKQSQKKPTPTIASSKKNVRHGSNLFLGMTKGFDKLRQSSAVASNDISPAKSRKKNEFDMRTVNRPKHKQRTSTEMPRKKKVESIAIQKLERSIAEATKRKQRQTDGDDSDDTYLRLQLAEKKQREQIERQRQQLNDAARAPKYTYGSRTSSSSSASKSKPAYRSQSSYVAEPSVTRTLTTSRPLGERRSSRSSTMRDTAATYAHGGLGYDGNEQPVFLSGLRRGRSASRAKKLTGKGASMENAIEIMESETEEEVVAFEHEKWEKDTGPVQLTSVVRIAVSESNHDQQDFDFEVSIDGDALYISVKSKSGREYEVQETFSRADIEMIHQNYTFSSKGVFFFAVMLRADKLSFSMQEFLRRETDDGEEDDEEHEKKDLSEPIVLDSAENDKPVKVVVYFNDKSEFMGSAFRYRMIHKIMQSTSLCPLLLKKEDLKDFDAEFYYECEHSGSSTTKKKRKTWDTKAIFTCYPVTANVKDAAFIINERDLARLDAGEFLNDKLINWYLQYIQDEIMADSVELKNRFFFFNSFFYTRLHTLDAHERFEHVKRWTKDVNVFERDFLVIPINEHLHWTLAVICWPGGTPDEADMDDEPTLSQSMSQSLSQSMTQSLTQTVGKLGGMLTYLGKNVKDLLGNPRSKRKAKVIQQVGKRQPCILWLDSLGNSSRKRHIFRLFEQFLDYEWNVKWKRPTKKFKLPVIDVEVRKQDNGSDCGVFTLHFAEMLAIAPPDDVRTWDCKDPLSHFKQKRTRLRALLRDMHEQFQAINLSQADSSQHVRAKKKKQLAVAEDDFSGMETSDDDEADDEAETQPIMDVAAGDSDAETQQPMEDE